MARDRKREAVEDQRCELRRRRSAGGGRDEPERLAMEAHEYPLLSDRAGRDRGERRRQLGTDELHEEMRAREAARDRSNNRVGIRRRRSVVENHGAVVAGRCDRPASKT